MDTNSIKIIGARCLVRELRESDELASGIIIPGNEKKQTNKGVVIAVGDGAMLENGTRVPMQVAVGDTVIYSSFSGSPIKEKKDDPETYLILNERDVLCVIEMQEEGE
jgi:chaperonin GroES